MHLLNKTDYSQSNFLLILQDGSLLFMFIVKGIDTSARPCGSVCQRQTHSFTQSIKIHDVDELTGHRVIAASRPKHTYSQTHTGLPLHTWHSDNLCTRLYRTLCAFLLKYCFPHFILCIIKCVLLIAEANVNSNIHSILSRSLLSNYFHNYKLYIHCCTIGRTICHYIFFFIIVCSRCV